MSVDQVADLTKIRTDHVRALEEGDFEAFSATIYIRGSVKLYAGMLKLDVNQLLATLDAELKSTEKFSELPPLVETKKNALDSVMLLLSKLNWKVGFAGIIAMVVVMVVGVIVWAWVHHKSNDPLKNLPPAVYQPANSGDTLPLPKH